MRTARILTVSAIAVSAVALTACGGLRQSIGLTKVVPDEFLTVASAPLTVPPEYGLRPPAPVERVQAAGPVRA